MFDRGFWTVTHWKGAPVRLHWSVPLGALLFSGGRLEPVFWLGFVALVLVHELGHAWVVRRTRHAVHAIDVHGFGGLCRWSGRATPVQRAAIAWGGVVAQAVLLVVTLLVLLVVGRPTKWAGAQLASVFVTTNLWLIGLNLLPIPPLDGAEAWPLVRHLWRSSRHGT